MSFLGWLVPRHATTRIDRGIGQSLMHGERAMKQSPPSPAPASTRQGDLIQPRASSHFSIKAAVGSDMTTYVSAGRRAPASSGCSTRNGVSRPSIFTMTWARPTRRTWAHCSIPAPPAPLPAARSWPTRACSTDMSSAWASTITLIRFLRSRSSLNIDPGSGASLGRLPSSLSKRSPASWRVFLFCRGRPIAV